jgi:uncharacterized protein
MSDILRRLGRCIPGCRAAGLPVTSWCFIALLGLAALELPLASCRSLTGQTSRRQSAAPPRARSFKVGEVRLLGGPFKESQDAEARYLLTLDLDRLVSPFLLESGLKPKAPGYPGWETDSLPGVALSFYLSGSARLYMATGNERYLANLKYLLAELSRCQERSGGYLLGSRQGREVFKALETSGYYPEFSDWGGGHGEPYYVMEKLLSGLMDAHRICGLPEALRIATNLADWLSRHMSRISGPDLQKIMLEEYGGMNWVLADLYSTTGDGKYLEMSRRWHDEGVLVPTTRGIDVLTGIHANTQFPKISGLAARYRYAGDPSDWKGATFFWGRVVPHRTFVTGGNSESEHFPPPDALSDPLTPFTTENCNSYNMLKLTSLLFQGDPKVEYADYIERTLFNHILSAQSVSDGRICYHLPLMPGASKFHRSLYDEFSCCVCSALDSYTRHSEYIYARTESEIFVNLFIASELEWKEKGIRLRQETSFPFAEVSSMKFECRGETELGLNIRYPYWLAGPMTIKVNGRPVRSVPDGGYVKLARRWKTGDEVEVRLKMGLRSEAMPDDRGKIAFLHGPIVLAGVLEQGIADELVRENAGPALLSGDKPRSEWLKPSVRPLEYITAGTYPDRVIVKPLFQINLEPYSVYWKMTTGAELRERLARRERRAGYARRLEALTFDMVEAGAAESEEGHSLEGRSVAGKGNYGILKDEAWRSALPGGFSYRLKTPGDRPISIFCRFMGREQHERWDVTIKADDVTVARLKRQKDDSYPVSPFAYWYPIPFEQTKGKTSLRVAFEVSREKRMPRLMELRVLQVPVLPPEFAGEVYSENGVRP